MDQIVQVLAEALQQGVRHLGEKATDAYDPVKGSLLDNDDFEVSMLIVVTVLVIGLGSLAAGAGIGGGGLFVPLFAFVLGVGAKAAVPMSKATILGGALGNMMSLAFARHPDQTKNKPLIDYEASTFMQSGELLGVVFGVLLNLILPEIVIIVFLAILLSFNAYKTLQKGVAKYKDESKKMLAKQTGKDTWKAIENQEKGTSTKECDTTPNNNTDSATLKNDQSVVDNPYGIVEGFTPKDGFEPDTAKSWASKDGFERRGSEPDTAKSWACSSMIWFDQDAGDKIKQEASAGTLKGFPSDVVNAVDAAKLQKILDDDAAQFPIWAWSMLAPMTIYTIFYAFIKKEIMSTCRPLGYWLWYFSPVPVLGLFMYATARILKQKHKCRVEAGYVFHGDGEEKPDYRDLKWTDETLKQFPTIAILAGVAAGLLGIGGGMVIGPLFIQLDMQPKVGSSSCAFMILWTAVSGVIQYSFAGKLGWQFILYGVVVGFISGQLGQRGVDRMLKKSGRPSMVIFLLGGIVLVACVAMTCTGVYKLIQGIADGDNMFSFDTYDLECHE